MVTGPIRPSSNGHADHHQAGRRVETDRGHRFLHLDPAGGDQSDGDPHRTVAAGRDATLDLHPDHADIRAGAGGSLQQGSSHRFVTTWLAHQERPEVAPPGEQVGPALLDRRAGQVADSVDDHPGRHSLGMGVDDSDRSSNSGRNLRRRRVRRSQMDPGQVGLDGSAGIEQQWERVPPAVRGRPHAGPGPKRSPQRPPARRRRGAARRANAGRPPAPGRPAPIPAAAPDRVRIEARQDR